MISSLNTDSPASLKAEILSLARRYSALIHSQHLPAQQRKDSFVGGVSPIPYAGRVFDQEEVAAAIGTTLDFWLTLGEEGVAFEKELASFLGVKHTLLVNSGSSANLIALCALTTHKLPDHRRVKKGDEVITVAAGFPTTIAPIVQVGAIPVFLDNDPITGNIALERLKEAYTPGKTKAVMMAHALGNPFDLGAILKFCQEHQLWLIEDNCDALGATYTMPRPEAEALGITENSPGIPLEEGLITRYTGTWGDLSTQSFYPPHHLTMGEGGAVNIVRRAPLKKYAESFRDWGRDCWCASGKDDTCAKRFGWQLGELPPGYDHKYIYTHLGYNLKPLDPQAAIGRRQLQKLPLFIQEREKNWHYLRQGLADLEDVFTFCLPTHAIGWQANTSCAGSNQYSFHWNAQGNRSNPSWFGFMLRVQPEAPFSHTDLARVLDEHKIGTRMFFGGNLMRQPALVQLKRELPEAVRIVGGLEGADEIMKSALFLGTYPGLTQEMLDYEIKVIHDFVSKVSRNQDAS